MNGGRFFNTAGLDQNGPEPQPNNFNNQGNFVGASSMNSNQQQGNPMEQGMFMSNQTQMMNNPMQQSNPMSQNSPMNMGNPMNNGNPMSMGNPMNNGNPMNVGNPMNNGNPMNVGNPMSNMNQMNSISQQGMIMNQEMAAQQSFSPMYQDPNPSVSPMNSNMNQSQGNPMASFPTGANQGPIGVQPNPMNMGNPMMNNNPMNTDNSMMNNNSSNQNNQQTIMMSSDTPTFNNSLNGISPLEPMPTAMDTGKTIKMKSKLNLDFKKILIIGVVCLVAIMVVLSLLCYKTVTCTGNEEVYGAPVEVVVKSYFWFGKINKVVTTKTVDLSKSNENDKDYIKGLYKDKESTSTEKIDIKDNKIVITSTAKPSNSDEASITADEFVDSYEKYNFNCK